MPYWAVGDVEGELARVRALRANPPGLAADDPDRRSVFGAALEQFEQLLRAAEVSGPASAPLPLFYALSQAGRAIAADRMTDPARWNYAGHGIKPPEGGYPPSIGDTELIPQKSGKSAFRVVSESTRSPLLETNTAVRLDELWASLPQTQVTQDLGGRLCRAIQVHPESGSTRDGGHASIRVPLGPHRDRLADLLASYPALREPKMKVIVDGGPPGSTDEVRAGVFWTLGGATIDEIFETYWSESALYLRPAVAGQPPPSILMTWWAVLFALSHLARYAPAVWTQAIRPDSSALTVPIEEGLRLAKVNLPRLVYHGITGSWAG